MGWIAVIIFVILLCIVGMLEGMQIAFFAVAKIPASDRGDSVFAKKTCELLFRGEGYNMPAFMVGRQLCVVSCMFFVARVTAVSIPDGGSNIFNVSQGLQEFFNLGFLGALITTILGSISWQLVAATFPIAFLFQPSYLHTPPYLSLFGRNWTLSGFLGYGCSAQENCQLSA